MNQTAEYRQRVLACFKALASGDAIGKQSEMLSHREVQHWYPEGVSGFHGLPGQVIPRYRGNRKHEWRIGETTDDTEQTIAVARALLSTREASHTEFARELLKCKKSLHPGVKSLWTLHQSGDPGRTASEGDGCGAAMRVAPVGVLYSPNRLEELVRAAREIYPNARWPAGNLCCSGCCRCGLCGLRRVAGGRCAETRHSGSTKSGSVHSAIEG